jgi:hypothetical protein
MCYNMSVADKKKTAQMSSTQNLDKVCAGGFTPHVRIAWDVWNIHQLVGAKIGKPQQLLTSLNKQLLTNLNKQTTHVERDQFRLQCIKCKV